jgi:hypothetical protein
MTGKPTPPWLRGGVVGVRLKATWNKHGLFTLVMFGLAVNDGMKTPLARGWSVRLKEGSCF